jgi:hypothetical protein
LNQSTNFENLSQLDSFFKYGLEDSSPLKSERLPISVSSPLPTDDLAITPRPTFSSGDLPAVQGFTQSAGDSPTLSDSGGPRIVQHDHSTHVSRTDDDHANLPPSRAHHRIRLSPNNHVSSASPSPLTNDLDLRTHHTPSRTRGRLLAQEFENIFDSTSSDDLGLRLFPDLGTPRRADSGHSPGRISTPAKSLLPLFSASPTTDKADGYLKGNSSTNDDWSLSHTSLDSLHPNVSDDLLTIGNPEQRRQLF